MNTQQDLKKIHSLVHGRVQGVGFRYFVQQVAATHNILGWVRNLRSGSVEIEAEGTDENLNAFLKLVARGPSGSHVDKLETKWLPATNLFDKFQIKRTFF